jgi:misacylated tRNA(Ala) deacylase
MMSTHELFRDDAYLVSASATVLRVDGASVLLDQTVFYPTGGGQANDAGVLTFEGQDLPVVDVKRERETGLIWHVLGEGVQPPPVGATVDARIDWQRRHKHMRFHTATHLLCAVVPYGTNGCSIAAETARLDFATGEGAIDKDHVASELRRLIALARPTQTRWITDAELDAQPELVKTMSVAPPRGAGRIRLLEIEGIDLQACGGTHVKNIAEIGDVLITKVEKISATNRRIRLAWA